ncbi:hypothetical protein ACIRU3_15275, partial [Streptomyces sp. NPDC101151]
MINIYRATRLTMLAASIALAAGGVLVPANAFAASVTSQAASMKAAVHDDAPDPPGKAPDCMATNMGCNPPKYDNNPPKTPDPPGKAPDCMATNMGCNPPKYDNNPPETPDPPGKAPDCMATNMGCNPPKYDNNPPETPDPPGKA